KVWHAPHFLAAAAPFSIEAVCSSFSIGSEAGAASFAPPSVASFAAIAKPGFSGVFGANSAWAVKLVTRRSRQVPRTAPIILLSSKESILAQAPGPKGVDWKAGSAAARERLKGESALSRRTPKQGLRYRFAPALATRISGPNLVPSPPFPAH